MKIAILTPMRQELAPVVQAFSLQKTAGSSPSVHTGTVGGTEIVAITTGIGTAGAKRATERALDLGGVDHVMVVGIAGGVGSTIQLGDLIIPEIVIDKSTGTEYRPAHLGQPAARGTIVTSDDFLVDPEIVTELEAAGVIGLDMETAAVAEVCTRRGCAWSVIRAVSDMATDHPDDFVMKLATASGPGIAKLLITNPGRIPHLMRLQRDSKAAATAAARAAAQVCARSGASG